MELYVKKYLETHSLADLKTEHGVCSRFSSDGKKISFNYDQILARAGDRIADQCRGLVLSPTEKFTESDDRENRTVGQTDILAHPMHRFYNHGDSHVPDINWKTARVLEKLDGTMIALYFDDNNCSWSVATRSVPDADIPMNDSSMTFSDLFWAAVKRSHGCDRDEFVNGLPRNITFVFELTSPLNRIVVKYEDIDITLIAARDRDTGRELAVDDARLMFETDIKTPQSFAFSDVDSVCSFVETRDPKLHEGIVVVDSNFNRLKIKSTSYIFASRSREAITTSKCSLLEIIIKKKFDDVRAFVDDDVIRTADDMAESLNRYIDIVNSHICSVREKAVVSRKDAALYIKSLCHIDNIYFSVLDGKVTDAREWFDMITESGKMTRSLAETIIEKIKS